MAAVKMEDIPGGVPFERTLDGSTLHVAYDEVTADRVAGSLEVTDVLRAPHGAIALGALTAVAEGAASMGTALAVFPQGFAATGLANDTTLTREVRDGRISFVAVPRAKAEDLWTWEVEARDGDGEVCALTKVLIAVRPLRRG